MKLKRIIGLAFGGGDEHKVVLAGLILHHLRRACKLHIEF